MAGERDKKGWHIEEALAACREALATTIAPNDVAESAQ
jgi:hypothetical protein